MPPLADNLARVRAEIAEAARRAGRDPAGVRLVGVTKYVDAAAARALYAAGCRDLGESRPQELWAKAADLADLPVTWHLVGRLQRNKVRRTLACEPLIHSADSVRLLEELDAEARRRGRPANVLLEVHLSGEASKQGFDPAELPPLGERLADWPNVRVQGLMGMASLAGGAAAARGQFARLRELREDLAVRWGLPLPELSMGMSGDFAAAIAEGATLVRIGSALFEGVPP